MINYLILIFVLLFFDKKTYGMYEEYIKPLIFGAVLACFAINKPIVVQLQILALGFFVSYFILDFLTEFAFNLKAKKFVDKEIEIPFDIHRSERMPIVVDDMPFFVEALSELKEGDIAKVVRYKDYVLYVDKIGGK
ncbi:MAG: Membrane protein implicated in regulation of membrane protease activity [Thermoanaerobacterium thermosaccharolyticum]